MVRCLSSALVLLSCTGVVGPLETWSLSDGMAALERGDAALALERFERAGPFEDDPRVNRNRAIALHQLGRDTEALKHLEKAVTSTDDALLRARAQADRCVILARLGRTRDGVTACRKALVVDPADDSSRKLLEVLLRLLEKSRLTVPMGIAGLSIDEATTVPRHEVIAVVSFDGAPPTLRGRRWRQELYEQFDGVRWSAAVDVTTVQKFDADVPTITQHVRATHRSALTWPIGLDPPLAFSRAVDAGPGEYDVQSPQDVPDVEKGVDHEAWRQLPPTLDPRIKGLATRATGEAQDPLLAAQRLVEYFRREYSYSLSGSEPALDPLGAFLFGQKQGSCRHFATAMAVMLRARGFSARPVGGLKEAEEDGPNAVLRADQAHAWVQVFSPARGGWATFDPTPPGPATKPITATQAATILRGIGSKPGPFRPPSIGAVPQPRDW